MPPYYTLVLRSLASLEGMFEYNFALFVLYMQVEAESRMFVMMIVLDLHEFFHIALRFNVVAS